MTRYADDICLSSNLKEVPLEAAQEQAGHWVVGTGLAELVQAAGFRVNDQKTKVKFVSDRQLITGLVVNKKIAMPRYWRRQLRTMFHLQEKCGSEVAMNIVRGWAKQRVRRTKSLTIDNTLSGKAGFAFNLERRDPVFTNALFRSFRESRRLIPKPFSSLGFRVYVEGKTDGIHLKKALAKFKERGQFSFLAPKFPESRINGSGDLIGYLRQLAKSVPTELVIGVLDCDEPPVMMRNRVGPGGYVQLSDNVYLMCLSPTGWCEANFCIEDLYPWEQASKPTMEGKRLFKSNEFGEDGTHFSGLYRLDERARDAIYVTGRVLRVEDDSSCLLSKYDFAKLVEAGEYPFQSISFEGFRATFDLLSEILAHYTDGIGGKRAVMI